MAYNADLEIVKLHMKWVEGEERIKTLEIAIREIAYQVLNRGGGTPVKVADAVRSALALVNQEKGS